MKKFLFVLFMVSNCTHLLTMEQPAPVPAAPQVPTYTLIGNDNQPVQIARNLIQQYAPVLAEKFTALGFKEAQTGQINLPDLDGQALQNFKSLLEQTAALEEINRKSTIEITQQMQQALANVVLPEGQGQMEREIRNKIVAEGDLAIAGMKIRSIERLKIILEELPKIGDHFLNLFNSIVQWRVPFILESAFGKFAIQHLNFLDVGDFKQLTDPSFAPRAQLLYLHNLEFNLTNYAKAYEWISLLLQNPAATADKQNKELLDPIINRINVFTLENIMQLLQANSEFKNLFLAPQMAIISDALRAKLIEKNFSFFEKKIMEMPHVLFYTLYLIDKNSVLLAKGDDAEVIDLKTGKIIKTILYQRVLRENNSVAHNKLIQNYHNKLFIYDLNTGLQKFATQFPGLYISRVKALDDSRLLINSNGIYIYDIRTPQVQPRLILFGLFTDITVINASQFLALTFRTKKLISFDVTQENILKEFPCDCDRIERINKDNYLLIKNDFAQETIDLQILNIISMQLNDKYHWKTRYILDLIPLDKHYAIKDNKFLIDLRTGTIIKEFPLYNVVKIDKNHIVGLKHNPRLGIQELIEYFIPQTSSLSEILDEIQRNMPPPQPPQLTFIEYVQPQAKRTRQPKAKVKKEPKKLKKEEKPK